MNVGENVRMIREMKGLSQQGLADDLGISQKTLSRIENGQTSPTLELMQKICDVFQIPLHQFLGTGTKKIMQLLSGTETISSHRDLHEITRLYEAILAEKERYIRSLEKQLESYVRRD